MPNEIAPGLVALNAVADDLGVAPAAVFHAARRLGIAMPRVGRGRLVETKHVAAIRNEIVQTRLANRKPPK